MAMCVGVQKTLNMAVVACNTVVFVAANNILVINFLHKMGALVFNVNVKVK